MSIISYVCAQTGVLANISSRGLTFHVVLPTVLFKFRESSRFPLIQIFRGVIGNMRPGKRCTGNLGSDWLDCSHAGYHICFRYGQHHVTPTEASLCNLHTRGSSCLPPHLLTAQHGLPFGRSRPPTGARAMLLQLRVI